MKKERVVKQAPFCLCDNECENGQPTPVPLHSGDTNEITDLCEDCRFLSWRNMGVIKDKNNN